MTRVLYLLIFVLFALFQKPYVGFAAEKLRVGHFPNFTHGQALIGRFNKIFEKKTGMQVEWKVFNAGPSAMEALFAGEIDFAYVGSNPAINAFIRSKGTLLKIIAGASNGGAALVVRKDAGIKKDSDFKGKIVASPEFGNTQDVAFKYWLKSKGFVLNRDLKFINVKNPDIFSLFHRKDLHAAWVPEPWVSRLIQEANGEIYLNESSIWKNGKFITTVLVVRNDFLNKNQIIVKKFLEAHVETTKWIVKNPYEAKIAMNNTLKQIAYKPLPDKIFNEAFTRVNYSVEPLQDNLFEVAKRAKELNFLPKNNDVDLKTIFELEPLNSILKTKKKR